MRCGCSKKAGIDSSQEYPLKEPMRYTRSEISRKQRILRRAYLRKEGRGMLKLKLFARPCQNKKLGSCSQLMQSYRSEDFANAAALYRELDGSQATVENEVDDLRINRGATDAQLEWTRRGDLVQKKKPGREDLEAFETAYNAACGSIARGELGQGEVLLKRARGG